MPKLTSSRLRRDIPAGLPNRVVASSADEERPAKEVPMPLMLCSLRAKPAARAWVERAPAATAIAVFNHVVFIVVLRRNKAGRTLSTFFGNSQTQECVFS